MKKRKRYQYTCRCDAYNFPHRFMSGYCSGLFLVEIVRRKHTYCKQCNLNNNGCEVLKGQESANECEGVSEVLHNHEDYSK